MTDRTKRTYRLDADTIAVIDFMAENSNFDKQEVVERAVKYYYRDYKNGKLSDPAMRSVLDDDIDLPDSTKDDEDSGGGIMSRFKR